MVCRLWASIVDVEDFLLMSEPDCELANSNMRVEHGDSREDTSRPMLPWQNSLDSDVVTVSNWRLVAFAVKVSKCLQL